MSTKHFYDKIYRYLFKNPKFIKALVKFAFPEKLYKKIDWGTVKGEKTHFVSKSLRSREADAIYEVQLKNKEKLYLYFLVEFQSTPDKMMALRLYIYIAMFYNELLSKGRIKVEVPIVLPVVLYTGDTQWTGAKKLSAMMNREVYRIVKDYVPELQYMLIDKNEYSESTLKKMRDAISGILYIEKLDGLHLKEKFEEILALFLEGLQSEEQEIFLEFIKIFFENKFSIKIDEEDLKSKEVPKMLEVAVNEWEERLLQEGMQKGIQKGRQEGKQEGIQEGRQEGIVTTAYRMLEKNLPINVISEVTGLSETEIEKLKKNHNLDN